MGNAKSYHVDPKLHVAVDCVIFGYAKEELKLLLFQRQIEPSYLNWSLLGGFVYENETLEMAAQRVLQQTVGLRDIYLEQVHAFSSLHRDPGARVISVAYYALIKLNEDDLNLGSGNIGKWHSFSKLPELIFDHSEMVDYALKKLQHKASYELIGKEFLPEMFTLTQLNNLYNAIFQHTFDQGNFRKKISKLNVLNRLEIKEKDTSKKGAYYYQFKENAYHTDYDRIVKF
ncbi:MAG: NUDIX domain-containing protein [Bacteroidales bacterium]|nr:NUDIX domain-containing protein [Bacteroidales bacterium]MCF8389852.1 NUDIX domain-containing protein [Bacteroidales bacterium]